MTGEQILDAIAGLPEETVADVRRKKPGGFRRQIAAAACVLLLVTLCLTAEADTGFVSNLLAPLFGSSRTELTDSIGIPLGASVTAEGYTLTAEAVIGDRYLVSTVYTLKRNDGQALPEHIAFESWSSNSRSGGSGSLSVTRDEEDPSRAHVVEEWESQSFHLGKLRRVQFSNLVEDAENGERIRLADGPWELSYTLRYPDTTENIPVEKVEIVDWEGKRFQLQKLLLSRVGVHLKLTAFEPGVSKTGFFNPNSLSVGLRMADGTIVPITSWGGGGNYRQGQKKAAVSLNLRFDVPLQKEEIRAIVICGVEIPIE